jgi:hypothetical protein
MFTPKELATVLAALRYYQQDWQKEIDEAERENRDPIAMSEHFDEQEPLTPDEIDDLCERINVDKGPTVLGPQEQ